MLTNKFIDVGSVKARYWQAGSEGSYGSSISHLFETLMLRISSLVIAVAGLAVTVPRVEAAPMNKCMVNGTVTYQQGLCPSDQVRKQPSIEELNAQEKKRRAAAAAAAPEKLAPAASAVTGGFSCDGRQYCSQMKSCAEARYFLANCPGAKMDGNRDGTPCEKQWCTSPRAK